MQSVIIILPLVLILMLYRCNNKKMCGRLIKIALLPGSITIKSVEIRLSITNAPVR
jgi:hypothetical protein